MNTKMKLAGLILGAAITTTSAYAASNGSCGAGKCAADMKKDAKTEMKDKAAGSCGAGKCAADMKKEAKSDMKDMASDAKTEMKDKAAGSCGAGKCGSK